MGLIVDVSGEGVLFFFLLIDGKDLIVEGVWCCFCCGFIVLFLLFVLVLILGSLNIFGGFFVIVGSGFCIFFLLSFVLGLIVVLFLFNFIVLFDVLVLLGDIFVIMFGFGFDFECEWFIVVGVDFVLDMFVVEKGIELDLFCIVDFDVCLKEGELKMGFLRIDLFGLGFLVV